MTEHAKIAVGHLTRQAIVYLRQSSPNQVERNRESTDRQYALAIKARELGWSDDRITIIDEDLGLSGSGAVIRSGFARLTAEVALGHVGLVLGLEVSRLARNNADWYRLIDLAASKLKLARSDCWLMPSVWSDSPNSSPLSVQAILGLTDESPSDSLGSPLDSVRWISKIFHHQLYAGVVAIWCVACHRSRRCYAGR
jgi:hypothetical protein